MSYFDDQEDAWFANDCKGRIEDYTPLARTKEPDELMECPDCGLEAKDCKCPKE